MRRITLLVLVIVFTLTSCSAERMSADTRAPDLRMTGNLSTATTSREIAMPIPSDVSLTTRWVQSGTARYVIQSGTPTGIPDFLHSDAPCGWSGVGGQIFDMQGKPMIGLIVEISGTLGGNPVSSLALTGGSTALGPGGYEIRLANQPVASQGTLQLQIYDLAGNPISDRISFNTYAECERSLVLINLVEVSATQYRYFPVVSLRRTKFHYFPLFMIRGRPR